MKIGLLGMGTVGGGVYELCARQTDMEITRVLEKRFQAPYITTEIADIVHDPDISLVVETLGGLHPAYEFAREALKNGKHFVTANKLLVSACGEELSALAHQNGCAFLYGAACGGGIPFLHNLALARETDHITALGGILNGTTNYILDAMQSCGMDYGAALAQAQALGYAEADPSSDVEGLDTMRKLVLGCLVGLSARVSPESIPTLGISKVLAQDIAWARAHGLTLRLCAFAARLSGGISAYVEPTLVPGNAAESAILKNVNYAWYEADGCGRMCYTGQGAGRLPTASNVLRDIYAVMQGQRAMADTDCAAVTPDNSIAGHGYYLRLPPDVQVPESWIAHHTLDSDWQYIETVPVSVKSMHACIAQHPGAFAAGIQKG